MLRALLPGVLWWPDEAQLRSVWKRRQGATGQLERRLQAEGGSELLKPESDRLQRCGALLADVSDEARDGLRTQPEDRRDGLGAMLADGESDRASALPEYFSLVAVHGRSVSPLGGSLEATVDVAGKAPLK